MPPEDAIRIRHMIEAAEASQRFITGRRRGDLDFVIGNPPFASHSGVAVASPFNSNKMFVVEPGGTGRRLPGRLARGAVREAAMILARHRPQLSDAGTWFSRQYGFEHASPDAVFVGHAETQVVFVDACTMLTGPPPAGAGLTRFLSETALAASVFRRYWLILMPPAEAGGELERGLTARRTGRASR